MTVPAIELERCYRSCEEITRREAANFYYGIRLLPREKRHAMSAVYAFARRIDDIGDEAGDPSAKLAALSRQREGVAAIDRSASGFASLNGWSGDPVVVGLLDARTRFDLPLEALELLIDGVELDVRGTEYETFDELVGYCRAVAGSIGRLCLAIFCGGACGREHDQLADDLGVAMQLTNILRDVREDFGNGRVYLPAEDLRRFGCSAPDVTPELIRFEADRAGEWFDRGMGLVEALDRRSASCLLAMTGIYRQILDRIAGQPDVILQRRVSLPAWEKAWLAARSLSGVWL